MQAKGHNTPKAFRLADHYHRLQIVWLEAELAYEANKRAEVSGERSVDVTSEKNVEYLGWGDGEVLPPSDTLLL